MLNRTRRHWDTRRYGTGSGERPEHRSIGLLIYAQVAPRSPYRTNVAWFDLAGWLGETSWLCGAEYLLEDAVHLARVTSVIAQQLFCGGEFVVGITQSAGARGKFLPLDWERVCLRVVDHLEFVLHVTQKD